MSVSYRTHIEHKCYLQKNLLKIAKKRFMLAHHVLFWLNADTTADQKDAFKKGLESLENIETVKTFHIGTPAPIDRPVVDSTYTFSLTIIFEDLAGHDVYQVHDLHKAFLDQFRVLFEKVVIYDAH
jgi:hypothetical protein